jgi:hypothetical protein
VYYRARANGYEVMTRSTDGGKTFTRLTVTTSANIDTTFDSMACDSTGQIVYGKKNVANVGYKSSDYGATWAVMSSFAPLTNRVHTKCSQDGNFVLMGNFASRDAGATWITVTTAKALEYGKMLNNGNIISLGQFYYQNLTISSLYTYVFNGTNGYTQTSNPLPTSGSVLSEFAASVDGRCIYIMSIGYGTATAAFVYSLDYGATFNVQYNAKFRSHKLSCSDDGSVIINSGYDAGMFRSQDYGATWAADEEWTDQRMLLSTTTGNQRSYEALTAPDGSTKYIYRRAPYSSPDFTSYGSLRAYS